MSAPDMVVPAALRSARLLPRQQPGSRAPMRVTSGASAEHGQSVFPLRKLDKRPAVRDWERRACSDPDLVGRYWPREATGYGVACGPSRLVVVDVDTHDPLPDDWCLPGLVDGRDVLAQLCEWAGQRWPGTYTVVTPTGGWHLYYAAPDGAELRNTSGALGPSIDTRAGGGYVVGAGSVIDERAYPDRPDLAERVRGGRAYEALADEPPAPLPAWLHRMLAPPQRAPGALGRPARGTPDRRLSGLAEAVRSGQPNDRTGPLVWAAHRLAEMISSGEACADDGDLLVQVAIEAGIRGGERYARRQVAHVLGAAR